MKISVVIPVYNEEDNIEDLCLCLENYCKNKNFELQFILVNDGSSDKTVEGLKQFSFQQADATLINLSKNYGAHSALRAGVSRATGDYCIFFSADLQEPVEMIDQAFDEIKKGYDLVYIHKKNRTGSKGTRFFSNAYAKLFRKYAISSFPEKGLNNMMFNKKIIDELNKNKELNTPITLQIVDMGFHSTSIECQYAERTKGESKWTFSKKIKLFIDSFVSFSFFPLRAVTTAGFFMAFCGILYALYIIIIKVFNIYPLEAGWPTLVALVLVCFGITNISLGIIAEYIWRTFDAARNRPGFIISEEIQLNCYRKKGEDNDSYC